MYCVCVYVFVLFKAANSCAGKIRLCRRPISPCENRAFRASPLRTPTMMVLLLMRKRWNQLNPLKETTTLQSKTKTNSPLKQNKSTEQHQHKNKTKRKQHRQKQIIQNKTKPNTSKQKTQKHNDVASIQNLSQSVLRLDNSRNWSVRKSSPSASSTFSCCSSVRNRFLF